MTSHSSAHIRPLGAAVSLFALAALASCAHSGVKNSEYRKPQQPVEKIFDQPLKPVNTALNDQQIATMVFVRPFSADQDPLNVYVNGRFLTTLLPGGYAEHKNCAGSVPVAAVYDDARIRHVGRFDAASTLNVEGGKTYYYRVDPAPDMQKGKFVLVPVASMPFGDYRRQAHVLPRAPSCTGVVTAAAPAAEAAAPLPEVVTAPLVTPAASAAAPTIVAKACGPDEVRGLVAQWRTAWEQGDYAGYRALYAPQFKKGSASMAKWEELRQRRLKNTDKKLVIGDITVASTKKGTSTEFLQDYSSKEYSDYGKKELVWKTSDGSCKIVDEDFTAVKR